MSVKRTLDKAMRTIDKKAYQLIIKHREKKVKTTAQVYAETEAEAKKMLKEKYPEFDVVKIWEIK